MRTQILRLNKAGQALEWICPEEAACFYAKGQVVWSFGEDTIRLHGGLCRMTGRQSILDIASIIATDGLIHEKNLQAPPLSSLTLFQRDGHLCMYCGQKFHRQQLTRDHVKPRGQGGKDIWENCVAACRSCNNFKGCRTPDQAGMKLIAIPFKPNKSEYLALANRNILADQMEFLVKGFSKNMRPLN